MHEAWDSGAAPASADELTMDDLTARQLADELTTLASSMFGLLQPHPEAGAAADQADHDLGTVITEAPPLQVSDPASVVSVAIPVEPVVAAAVQESTAAAEPDAEAPALAVPALAVPELPEGLDELDRGEPTPASLSLVPAIELPEGPDSLDGSDNPDQPDRPGSMALLNEIAFLDD